MLRGGHGQKVSVVSSTNAIWRERTLEGGNVCRTLYVRRWNRWREERILTGDPKAKFFDTHRRSSAWARAHRQGLNYVKKEKKRKQMAINAEKKKTLLHCWWKCELEQTLWTSVWTFLKKLKMGLPYTSQEMETVQLSTGVGNTKVLATSEQ